MIQLEQALTLIGMLTDTLTAQQVEIQQLRSYVQENEASKNTNDSKEGATP